MTQTNIFAFFLCWFRPVCELALPGPCSFLSSLVSTGKLLLFFVMNLHNCTPLLGRCSLDTIFPRKGLAAVGAAAWVEFVGSNQIVACGLRTVRERTPSGHPSCRGIALFLFFTVQHHVGFLFVPLFCSFCYSRSTMIYSSSSGLAALMRGWVLFYRLAVPSSQRPGIG